MDDLLPKKQPVGLYISAHEGSMTNLPQTGIPLFLHEISPLKS